MNNTFEAYFMPGFTTFKQIHGQLTVANDNLQMHDDAGKVLFNIGRPTIVSITDDMRSMKIKTTEKKYILFFYDNKKLMPKSLFFGSVAISNKTMSESQELCLRVLQSLQSAGYQIELNKHRQ
ncbi:MAG: hypothetical protein U0451_00810 [Candidatus Saccharimonadales bacterium]